MIIQQGQLRQQLAQQQKKVEQKNFQDLSH